jgi:hypothetical protein
VVSVIRLPLPDLRHEIRRAVMEIGAASAALDSAGDDLGRDACRTRLSEGLTRLEQLGMQLPQVPRTLSDLVTLAELAHAWADKDAGGRVLGVGGRLIARWLRLWECARTRRPS